jgi:hypothetical protein
MVGVQELKEDWLGFCLFLMLVVVVMVPITLWAIAKELKNIGKEVVTYG